MDQPHPHNQNPVGANGHSPLLWSTEMKTAVMLENQRLNLLVFHKSEEVIIEWIPSVNINK